MSGPISEADAGLENVDDAVPGPGSRRPPEPGRRRGREPGPAGVAPPGPAHHRRVVLPGPLPARGSRRPARHDRAPSPHRAADRDVAARRRVAAHGQPGERPADPARAAQPDERGQGSRPRRGRARVGTRCARRAALGRATGGDPARPARVRASRRAPEARARVRARRRCSSATSAARAHRRAPTPHSSARTSRSTARSSCALRPEFEYGFVVLTGALTIEDTPDRSGRARVPGSRS